MRRSVVARRARRKRAGDKRARARARHGTRQQFLQVAVPDEADRRTGASARRGR